jgi:O-methyltransferase involved in polyketide biosynthesis
MEQVGQLVAMGAGYDMRAYGKLQRKNVLFFELDLY